MKNKESMTKTNKIFNWIKSPKGIITITLIIATLLLIFGNEASAATIAVGLVTGVEGGKHVVDGPVTTDIASEASNELLRNEIDQEIVKIRPMATPIDQLSRCAGSKHSGSMIVDYYNVDTKPTKCVMKVAHEEPEEGQESDNDQKAIIDTSNNDMFDVSDTILVSDDNAEITDANGNLRPSLVLYVTGKTDDGRLAISAVNGKKIGDVENCIPSIASGTKLIRMGRAATELDVQTPQFEAMPKKDQNFCQIFKMQIEQSTLQKIANKEVGWNMSDQEEAAIYDMRLGMEKNFLFGVRQKIYDSKKKEPVYLTGGIWYQAGKDYTFKTPITESSVIEMMKEAFTGNAGSKRKILVGGSDLICALNKLDFTRMVSQGESTTKWGIDFSEICSKFGRIYVLLSEIFDECGMSGKGIIIDPEYIQKYSHLPFGTEALDLKTAGVRNSDALVVTEASCLVLRYPKAHMRVSL